MPSTADLLDDESSPEFFTLLNNWSRASRKRGWTLRVDIFYWQVLYYVICSYPDNPVMVDIRKAFQRDKASIRDAVKFWRTRRILQSYPCPRNRRTYRVELTEEGRRFVKEINPHDLTIQPK